MKLSVQAQSRAISRLRLSHSFKGYLSAALILALVCLPMLASPRQAAAATLTVNNLADTSVGNCLSTCSLRDAIALASSGDTITFKAGLSGTISLASTLTINQNLTLQGPGTPLLTIDGKNAVGIFTINSGMTVTISGLTIQHGNTANGGGIYNNGTLTVSNGAFSNNSATSNNSGSGNGGGIYNNGTLTVSNGAFSNNSAINTGGWVNGGGGIYNSGTLTVNNSTFSNNSTSGSGGSSGGGIYGRGGTLTVNNSTLANNSAAWGGGIANDTSSIATVSNTTLAGNTATNNGGGIYNGATATVSNTTVSGNTGNSRGGGLYSVGTSNLGSTILAGNTSTTGPDMDNPSGTFTSLGYNLIANTSGSAGWLASDLQNTNPLLETLASNGGPTQTMALQAGSPAIYKGNCNLASPASTVSTDQRGQARKSPCDVGAYEVPPTAPAFTNSSGGTFTSGTAGSVTITTVGVPTPSLSESGTLPASVTFTDNGDGTATLANSTAAAVAGIYPLTITAHNGVSPDAQQVFMLVMLTPGSLLTPQISAINISPNPSVFGVTNGTTFTVIVSGPNGEPTPTGQVHFTSIHINQTAVLGPITYLGHTVNAAQFQYTNSATGNFSVQAVYQGDSNYTTATSPLATQVVKWDSSVVLSEVQSTTSQSVTFTVTVSRYNPSTPTTLNPSGQVEISENNTSLGIGTLALVGGVPTARITVTTLTPGGHVIRAYYTGDSSFAPGNFSNPLSFTVKALPIIALTSSANPSAYGSTVNLTASIVPGNATGTVTFKDATTTLAGSPVTLNSGVATLSISNLSHANHSITAVYSGDSYNLAKTSAVLLQVVKWGDQMGMSILASTVVYGQPFTTVVSVTRDVNAPATLNPSGAVNLLDGDSTGPKVASGTLVTGSTSINVNGLSVGTHPQFTAVYPGDINFVPNLLTSAIPVIVGPANTTTTVTSSTAVSSLGQGVTFTATIGAVAPSTLVPTGGTVTFYDNGAALNSTPVNMVNGKATFTTTAMPLGTYQITATYSGNTNYNGSTGSEITHFVYRAPTGLLLKPSTSTATVGQPITYSITLKPAFPKAGTPTGSVTVKDGSTVLGTVTVTNGTATFTTSTLSAGTHAISLEYSGDASFMPNSAQGTTQSVKAPTTTNLSSLSNPSTFGQSVTLSATVSATVGDGSVPTGIVVFKEGSTTLGSAALSGGTATFNTSRLLAGSHILSASYAGDDRHFASVSPAMTQIVNKAAVSLAVNATSNAATQTTTFTVVLGGAPGMALPGGTVSIQNNGVFLGTAKVITITQNGVTSQQATFSMKLPAGTHTIVVTYSGDGNYTPGTSQPYTLTVAIPTASTSPTGTGFTKS